MKAFISFLIYCCISIPGYGQNSTTEKLNELFTVLDTQNLAMGSISVFKSGSSIYSKATGFNNVGESGVIPADVNTSYRIGSISKMYTAVMILQLVDEGKLSLSDKLDKYIPGIGKDITMKNLLNHTSGIHNFTDDEDYEKNQYKSFSREELIKLIRKKGVDSKPGVSKSYSNSNYALLALILEDITKDSYANNLKNRICDKLQLKNTYAGTDTNKMPNESYSYSFTGTWNKLPSTNLSVALGAGNVVSTSDEVNKFVIGLFTGKLLKPATLEEMLTIPKGGAGLGVFRMNFQGRSGYGHTGGIDGFSSVVGYFPSDSIAITYIANGVAYETNEILLCALSIIFGKECSMTQFTAAFDADKYREYCGQYKSDDIALELSVSINKSAMVLQATGQDSFVVKPISENKFAYPSAGIEIEFVPGASELILYQGGEKMKFKKKK